MSQEALGKKLGMTPQAVGKIERGETLRPKNARLLMDVLGLSPGEILDASDSPLSPEAVHVALIWEGLPDSARRSLLDILEHCQQMAAKSPGLVDMMFAGIRAGTSVHEAKMASYDVKPKPATKKKKPRTRPSA